MRSPYDKALVLGAGISGLGAARLLASEGTAVTLVDQRPVSEWMSVARVCEEAGVSLCGGAASLPWGAYDICVVSPGIPVESDWVQAAYAICAEVLPEFELGWRRAQTKTIAVTGSNGKSTVVKLCAETLSHAGLTAVAAGNYGRSVCAVAQERMAWDWLVLEVSSFQLETAHRFRPDIGCLTNIHPNHLDRHGTMEHYVAQKARLFAHMTEKDYACVPDNWLDRMRNDAECSARWSTFGEASDSAYAFREGYVMKGERVHADLRGTLFESNASGSAAASVAAITDAAGISGSSLEAAAKVFEPLPFRLQRIAGIDDVEYINDSKSTNFAAMAHAVRSMNAPVRLIAGGLAKENDYESIKEVLTDGVRSVYLIGQAAEEMFAAWSRDLPCEMSGTLERAVGQSRKDAQAGEVILFSPGCASFDQFRNYEERGEHFTRLVRGPVGKGTS